MKIRIRGNSLRLRLVQAEVEQFAEQGVITEATTFPLGPSLHYALEMYDGAVLTARLEDTRVRVLVPRAQAKAWATSNEVSLAGEEETPGGVLKLLVEKDFVCINPQAVWQEDQSDNFPNPNTSCGSKPT